jgi:ATP-binding cassette, subfamily B, bacterial
LFFVGVTLVFSKSSHWHSVEFARSCNILYGNVTDVFTNILNVILLNNKNYEQTRLNKYLSKHREKERKLFWSMFKISVIQGLSVTLFTACLIFVMLNAFKLHEISVGDFAFVMIISGTIIRNIYSISSDLVKCSKELGGCVEAISILTKPQEIINLDNAQTLKVSKGALEFRNVSFQYNKNKPIFVNKFISIVGGQKVALVGTSGGGKTTLINLLTRLFDVQDGSIVIDGQVLSNQTLESIRTNITMISQEPTLFNRSVFDNIQYGMPTATPQQVIDAAKKAHCHEFIKNLPDKYHTLVGERGVKLSGGQKQRVAIARAFLSNAKILLFDEPTSALDYETEKLIQMSLNKLWKDKTVIVVAHRLSTLQRMDRILVIRNGEICQDGSHNQLCNKAGFYQELLSNSL